MNSRNNHIFSTFLQNIKHIRHKHAPQVYLSDQATGTFSFFATDMIKGFQDIS